MYSIGYVSLKNPDTPTTHVHNIGNLHQLSMSQGAESHGTQSHRWNLHSPVEYSLNKP